MARTITHCPPPPLREGHRSGPNGSASSNPEPPLSPPPPPQNSPSSSFPTYFFSSSLCCSSTLFYFNLKLVYRSRREAACGGELSLLSFEDVISVVVPQRTFSPWRETKSQQFLHDFLYVLYLSLNRSPVFCKWWQKEDLPLNVQDVFSHTWTGFSKTSVGELVWPFLPFETADFLENL